MEVEKIKRGWLNGKTTLTVTSPFGKRCGRLHAGIDIDVPVGTKIFAPFSGKLTCKKQGGGRKGYGMYLLLKSGNIELLFAHLSKSSVSENVSKKVSEGAIIGHTGGAKGSANSGSSTGAHLHFEVHVNGKHYNPKYFLSDKLVGKIKQNSLSAESVVIPNIGETADDDVKTKIEISQLDNDISENTDIDDEVDDSATEGDDVTEYETKDALASGIWQIIKLAIDSDVANYRIHDASTAMQSGSLNNFFNKMCQRPLVEFTGDTFGDQYYFLIRKPPFDKECMKKTLETQGLLDEELYENKYMIYENDVISSNISFNTQNIYSWFQLIPMYENGAADDLKYCIPAVLFPEYAAIWGSRSLTINSQYRNFTDCDVCDKIPNGEKTVHGDAEARHSLIDLHYLIESNAYNPFVRSGSIQILGNRQIKRGMFIQVTWNELLSQEIFYVDSVTHDYTINNNSVTRTTTLNLSHGMLKDFMFNTDPKIKNSNSYFNLIDFGTYDKSKQKLDLDNWKEVISSWKVNYDIFMFFLKKLQFITNVAGNSSDKSTVTVVAKSK